MCLPACQVCQGHGHGQHALLWSKSASEQESAKFFSLSGNDFQAFCKKVWQRGCTFDLKMILWSITSQPHPQRCNDERKTK